MNAYWFNKKIGHEDINDKQNKIIVERLYAHINFYLTWIIK